MSLYNKPCLEGCTVWVPRGGVLSGVQSTVSKGVGDAVFECLVERMWVGYTHTATGPSRWEVHGTRTQGLVVPHPAKRPLASGKLQNSC